MTRNRPSLQVSSEDDAFVRSLIIFENADLIGFNKPSGLPVQNGRGIARSLDSLLPAFAKSNGKRPRLVHRLDAGTSGVIVVAKTQPASAFLSAEFAARRTQKTYVALVGGKVPSDESGVTDASVVKVEESGRARMIVARADRKGALQARTAWRVLAKGDGYALMQLSPETGRMHQIRIHLAHMGCPILGDPIYGTGVKEAPRLMLHALSLGIAIPSGGSINLRAGMPEEFDVLMRRLGVGTYSGL